MATREKHETLKWEVEVQPVYTTGEVLLRGYQTLIRSDKNIALSIMKNSYHHRSNADFMKVANELAIVAKSKAPYYIEYDSGRKVLAYLENSKRAKIGSHTITDTLLIGNSFDGSSSFFVSTVFNYNGTNFTYANKRTAFRVSHRSKSLESCFDYIDMIRDYEEEKELLFSKFDLMTKESFNSDDIIEELIKAVVQYENYDEDGNLKDISTKTKNKINELKDSIIMQCNIHGKNVWGLFNGITHYTSNIYTGSKKRNVEGNMYGTQNSYNQRGLNFCLDMV